MFTSREFNTFINVAEKMSIKLAAEELNITSPAVCSMIKKLEQRIGHKLFFLENNRMTLTKYGERIYSLTESHFHTLKSLEAKMKSNKEIMKIFIAPEYLFLSHHIINKLKKKSIDIILTSIIDDSNDIVIDCKANNILTPFEYNNIVSHLFFYVAYDKKNTCEDVFIHSDHAHLINELYRDDIIQKLKDEVGIGGELTPSSNIASMIEMVTCALGYAILPHTCSLLKCLFNSNLDIIIKKIDVKIEVYIHIHHRVDPCIIEHIFDN